MKLAPMSRDNRFRLAIIAVTFVAVVAMAAIAGKVSAHSPAELLTELRAAGVRTEQHADLTRLAERRAAQLVDCHAEGAFSRCHDIAYVQARTPGTWTVGEVLAWNPYPDDIAAEAAVMQWMASAGHRDILRGDWNAVGVGTADAGERHYFVAVFASIPQRAQPEPRAPRAERQPRTPETRGPVVPAKVAPNPTLPPTDTKE